eukprot:594494-Prymnesium_polylepis.1
MLRASKVSQFDALLDALPRPAAQASEPGSEPTAARLASRAVWEPHPPCTGEQPCAARAPPRPVESLLGAAPTR